MSVLTRRDLLELGLKLTGAATVLGLAATSCAPGGGDADAGDDHDAGHDALDAGGDAVDAGQDAVDAGQDAVDAGNETVDAGEEPQACAQGASHTAITNNHGHSFTITLVGLQEAPDSTVSIKGAGSHDHTVTLTAADKATLLAGGSVSLTSTSTGHDHLVTIRCVTG